MFRRRIGVITSIGVGLLLALGAATAGARSTATVLRFHDGNSSFTGVGFDANDPNAVPTLGDSYVIRIRLENIGQQFGKPTGTIVGRVLINCSVLYSDPSSQTLDGICNGIAHIPNGFLTFEGNAVFNNTQVDHWAITGGIGPYQNARGQINVVNHKNGTSDATVMLSS
jgi:hypothetical protein